jgi:hypothetical protein
MTKKYISLPEYLKKPVEEIEEFLQDFKVPEGIEIEKDEYDAYQCAEILHPNLPKEITAKLDVPSLVEVLDIQGEYMDMYEGDELLNEENLDFLTKKCKESAINLNADELDTIFSLELGYLYLIGMF